MLVVVVVVVVVQSHMRVCECAHHLRRASYELIKRRAVLETWACSISRRVTPPQSCHVQELFLASFITTFVSVIRHGKT